MNTTRLSLICLFVCLAGAALNVKAQSNCTNSKPKDFTVLCKDRYFLGETPTITVVTTNTGRSLRTVNDAEHQKFSLEMTWLLANDSKREKAKAVYDCCWWVPEQTDPNITYWYTPVKIRTKYVTLRPGQSTSVTVDLPRAFNMSSMDVSKYTLTLKFANGKKIVRKFEVYFDDEKSLPIFAKMIESNDQREWAVYTIAEYNRPALVRILEELAKSPNQKQRDSANQYLTQLKAGGFDPLRLHVDSRDRYSLNENPEIEISIENFTSAPEKVKEAQQQKFFLELRRLLPNQSEPEIKSCVYTPAESQQKPRLVTLLERDETSFMLNLQECFGSRLEAGSYELIVKPEVEPRMRDQSATRKFEIR